MRASDVLTAIDQATWKVRKDEDGLLESLKSLSDDIERLRSEQTEQYKGLAVIRLDELDRAPVVDNMSAMEKRAKDGFATFKAKARELEQTRREIEAQLVEKETQQPIIMNQLEDAQEIIVSHEEMTRKRLQDDAGWQDATNHVASVANKITAAEEKTKASGRDRDEKSKPYHADKLFVYLDKRKYGTLDYTGSFLTRWGDAYVAHTIGYEEARQNYYLLNEIPKRLGDHVTQLRKELTISQDKQNAYLRVALESDGILELEETAAKLIAEQNALQEAIRDLNNKLDKVNSEYQLLLHGNHPNGLNAVVLELVTALKQEDLRILMREALQTPTPKDEAIVEKLGALEKGVGDYEKEVQKIRETLRTIAQRRAELERSREDFHHSQYDRRGGAFGNEKDISEILGGMIGGVLTSRQLRDALRRGYRAPPRRRNDDDFFGGGWGGGGGFGGGFGGGGHSGGGGFRTGGGF